MRSTPRLLLTGFVLLQLMSLVSGQDKERTLDERKNRHPNTPIEIVSRNVGSTAFTDMKSFKGTRGVANPDWLKDLTLSVKNVSEKNIVRFNIILTVPKQGGMEFDAAMQFIFPQPERLIGKDGKPTGKYARPTVMVLHPGEIVQVRPWGLDILESIKAKGVTDVEAVSLLIDDVVYDDGTGWRQGWETRADPDHPGNQVFVRRLGSVTPIPRSSLATFNI